MVVVLGGDCYVGGIFPFVRKFDVIMCMGGLDVVCFYMCGSYSF